MSDIIGILGVGIILFTYFLLQIEKLKSLDLIYSVLNLIGAVFLLYSLFYNWNLPSVIIELFWILISLYGIYKYYKNKS